MHKCLNLDLIFRLFLYKVEVKKQVEQIIAIRNGKLKCLNLDLIFRLFLHKVEVKKQVEQIIAIRNGKLRDFQIRWEFLT